MNWDEELAMMDDLKWAWVAWRRPFAWHAFTAWWVARRYVEPRDQKKR